MKINNKSILIVITTIFLSIFFGCNNSAMNSVQGEKGKLILLISNNDGNSRTITPNVSTEIIIYDISGLGPEGETFETQDIMRDSTFEMNLSPGMWSITVYGKNTDGVLLASAVKDVYISGDKVTNEEIYLLPLSGEGSVQYTLSWSELSITNLTVNTELINQSNDEVINVTVAVSDDKKSLLIDSPLESGYYTLSIELFDGDILVWGNIYSVRILANQLTSYDGKVQ